MFLHVPGPGTEPSARDRIRARHKETADAYRFAWRVHAQAALVFANLGKHDLSERERQLAAKSLREAETAHKRWVASQPCDEAV